MPFRIRLGVPEMEAYWNDLTVRKLQSKLDKHEEKFSNQPAEDQFRLPTEAVRTGSSPAAA